MRVWLLAAAVLSWLLKLGMAWGLIGSDKVDVITERSKTTNRKDKSNETPKAKH